MKHPRDILNEIKWRTGLELKYTVVFYRDRVRPDLGYVEGSDIADWDKSFIYTRQGSAIPFHRVQKILHKKKELYNKEMKD